MDVWSSEMLDLMREEGCNLQYIILREREVQRQ